MNAVDSINEKWDNDIVRTHSADCWQWHPSCAIKLLADEIYHLRSLIEAWADADDIYSESLTNKYHDSLESAYDALRQAVGR